MGHPIVDIFRFQESLLMQMIFTAVILAMVWAGFRRWLQHREKMGRLTAEQAAERAAQMDRVEARLTAVEQIVSDEGRQASPRLDAPDLGRISKREDG